MKKIVAFVLLGALLLSLAGCQIVNPETKGPDFVAGVSHTDYSGMEIRVERMQNDQELVISWDNQTDFDVIYGEAFTIERLEEDEWVRCDMREMTAFEAIGYLLQAGQTKEETYHLSFYYDMSAPGTYRFLTECYIQEKPENSTKCQLWAEFTVGTVKCPEDSKNTPLVYGAQYIRTNGYQYWTDAPTVSIISSLQELNDYYNTWHEVYDLERKEKVYSDTTIGFLDACDKYDAEFFEENYLIFVVLEEGSGSIRHKVASVEQTADKKLSIGIDRKVPEVGTDDMAQWHIIVELSRENLVQSLEDVLVYTDEKLVYAGEDITIIQLENVYTQPPQCTLITSDGNTLLTMGGYDWAYQQPGSDLMTVTIADQVSRPLPLESLTPVHIDWEHAESVYSYVERTGKYALTNQLGFPVKLHFEVMPDSVTYACWPDAETGRPGTETEEVEFFRQEPAFYAKPGGYIYEIVAEWEDRGVGFYGTANYYVYIVGADHDHEIPTEAQTVEDPFVGYCGNTQTTLYIRNKIYSFMYGHSVTLTEILHNLDYQRNKTCRCMAEYTVDTEFGIGYEINLTEGFARFEKGQADLTQEQIDTIAEIIQWAETTNGDYVICD